GLFGVGALVPLLAAHEGGGSWRLVWLIFAGVGALALVLTLWLLRDPPGSPLPEAGREAERGAVPVYRRPRVLGVGLAYGLGGFAFSVQSLFMLSFMLSTGVPAAVAGSLVSLNGLLSVVSGLGWGWLSDRLGRGPAMTLAALLALLATLAPVLHPALPGFTLHWLVLGATMTGLFTLFQASGSEGVAPADAPLALSAVTLFFALGQLVGPALAGRLIDHAGASSGGGFRLVFALTSLALLLALGLSLWLWRSGVRRGAG
ncbi:MAG: MFS transporter, partial [Deinococcus sp.]